MKRYRMRRKNNKNNHINTHLKAIDHNHLDVYQLQITRIYKFINVFEI